MFKIKDDVYWVGAIDWDLRNFHGYITPTGSSYNAYLILDEKPTLIDTVKHYCYEEMLHRIQEIIDPKEIRYIISNHTEMDHSGSLGRLLSFCPNAEVICSPKGQEGLTRHFLQGEEEWKFKVVNTGDELNIGQRKLKFVLMPMVHWPDSMATYSEKDNILFPNDAFGQHYASSERYADELGLDIVYAEAAKYYANIILPYGSQVQKVLETVSSLTLDMICPSHGLIWRRPEDIRKILALYKKWAAHETDERVVIAYDTMWHSTEKMAHYLFELFSKNNVPVDLINLQETDISDIVTKILSAHYALFGSPILNNRMLPTMARLMMYLKGLKPQQRLALTFGSYGWAKGGFKELEASVTEVGFELAGEGQYIKFIPNENDLKGLDGFADLILDKIKK